MTTLRHDWSIAEVQALFELPFNDLLFKAQSIHRENFDQNAVQVSTLLSIKTGACPEDCKYCPQSNRYDTGLEAEKLMEIEKVINEARAAKESGATRFCMGAAWRSPKKKDMPYVTAMVKGVKEMGLESYPVYTRKPSTDLSYQVCAERLIMANDVFYPQFATHNAHTVAAVLDLARSMGRSAAMS